ncbi:Uncharacterised protein [Mycobacteroides abscessus subsp. bolletii]|nr:Uncharacterised protein [Mycobacteroides abscessus subsp. bolletii]
MVRGEHHIGVTGVQIDGLGDIPRPDMRIAYQRATQCQQIVQGVGRVLGHAERPALGKMKVHLGGSLGARRELENHVHTVDRLLLPGVGDIHGWRDQRDGAERIGLPQAGSYLPERASGQKRAVHVDGTTGHRGSGVHVLGHRMFQQAGRRQHGAAPGRHILGAGHPQRTPEMVHMRVRIDQPGHGTVTAMVPVQRQPRGRGLDGHQRVDHDDSAFTLDQRHIRDVQAPNLIDALGDVVKPLADVQPALAPQAGVHRSRARALQERVRIVVPHHLS